MNIDGEFILGSISIMLSVVIAVLGWIMQRKIEQIKIMQHQLSDKKYNAYADLVSLYFYTLKNSKKNKNSNNQIMREKMIESKKNILIYGSDNVINAFNNWLCTSSKDVLIEHQMSTFLDLMIEIRKDMSGNASKISKYDILLCLTQNQKETEYYWKKMQHIE